MFGNENNENGLKCFFFEKELSPLFSFVQLPMVFVHSGKCFCTFTGNLVQMLNGFCTVGFYFCTLAFYVLLDMTNRTIGFILCTFGSVYCTFGSFICTYGGI